MVWALLALLCVLAAKFLTSVRLRDSKTKLEVIQPQNEELRLKVKAAEGEVAQLKEQIKAKQELLIALRDVVRNFEKNISQSSTELDALERVQLMQNMSDEEAGD